MTFAPHDIGLSPAAAARLDEYLRQVRGALAGSAEVSPDEIEADIREHVENELTAAPRPVPLPALEAVLAKLGPPSQWGATPAPTFFGRVRHLLGEGVRDVRAAAVERARRVRFVLWSGPEDWRLAYLSFGVLALGALTVVVFPIALLVSYVLSRASRAVAREKGAEIDTGRKWLLYPPLVIVSTSLLVAVVAWPLVVGVWAASEVGSAAGRVQYYDRPERPAFTASDIRNAKHHQEWKTLMTSQVEEDRKLLALVPVAPHAAPFVTGLFVGFGALMVWWTVVGFATASAPGAVRAVFCPLLGGFERRHGLAVAFPCLALSVAWCVAATDCARAAGLL